MIFVLIVHFFLLESVWPQICPASHHWVKAHRRRDYYRVDGTFVSATDVVAHCQSNSRAFDYWNSRFKDGSPPDWPHKSEKPKPWTVEERERVIDALDDLPKDIWQKTISGIYRMDKSHTPGNPSTWAINSSIVLYDGAFKLSRREPLGRYLAHELAHEMYEKMPEGERTDYDIAANWLTYRDKYEIIHKFSTRAKDTFVVADGLDAADEDFANNLDHYLFESPILKSKTPRVYTWFEQRYGDKIKVRRKGKK